MKSLSDQMIPSQTGRATYSDDDHHYRVYQTRVRWTLFFLLVTMLSIAMAWHLVKRAHSAEPVRGEITINVNGDVLSWTQDAANVTGVKNLKDGDVFSLLPFERRDSARIAFHHSLDGHPYQQFGTFYRVDGGYVDMKFGPMTDHVCAVKLSRMRY